AGQHHGRHVAAVVQQVLLDGERAHAVPEEHVRNVRMLGLRQPGQYGDVVDQRLPAARTELAQCRCGGRGGGTVAAVVLAHDDEARAGERTGERVVAADVLAHAVGQLDDAARWPGRVPALSGDRLSVAAGEGELTHPRILS